MAELTVPEISLQDHIPSCTVLQPALKGNTNRGGGEVG